MMNPAFSWSPEGAVENLNCCPWRNVSPSRAPTQAPAVLVPVLVLVLVPLLVPVLVLGGGWKLEHEGERGGKVRWVLSDRKSDPRQLGGFVMGGCF